MGYKIDELGIDQDDVLSKEIIRERLVATVNVLSTLEDVLNDSVAEFETVNTILPSDRGTGIVEGINLALAHVAKLGRAILEVTDSAYPNLVNETYGLEAETEDAVLPGEEG